MCQGTAVGPYFLGHRFLTDVLLLRLRTESPVACSTGEDPRHGGRPGRIALTSLVEALALAASRTLQIDEGELAGNWSPVLGGGGGEAYVFLYDLLPGGAGYTRLVKENLDGVLAASEELLDGCDCESSCYRCLRHFGNAYLHTPLDRHLALSLLRQVLRGEPPQVSAAEQQAALTGLREYLRLKGLAALPGEQRAGQSVPLLMQRLDESEIWLDVHHPLVDAEGDSPLSQAAGLELLEYYSFDTFTLRHDLPGVVAQLEL
jgi:hypothetical protein